MRLILALCLPETREQRGEPVKPGPEHPKCSVRVVLVLGKNDR